MALKCTNNNTINPLVMQKENSRERQIQVWILLRILPTQRTLCEVCTKPSLFFQSQEHKTEQSLTLKLHCALSWSLLHWALMERCSDRPTFASYSTSHENQHFSCVVSDNPDYVKTKYRREHDDDKQWHARMTHYIWA